MFCKIGLLLIWVAGGVRSHIDIQESVALAYNGNKSMYVRDIVEGALMRQAKCQMQHKLLVIIASVHGVPKRSSAVIRGKRMLHCTLRLKDAENGQIADKLRTDEKVGKDLEWNAGMLIPVACPSLPTDVNLEFNIRDSPSFPQVKYKQIGQVVVPVASLKEGESSFIVGDNKFTVKLNSNFCNDMECVRRFLGTRKLISHPGLDCGSGCHNALKTLTKDVVQETLQGFFGSYDHEWTDMFQNEVHMLRAMKGKNAWDYMRSMLAQIPRLAQKACGNTMPLLPSITKVLGEKLKEDYTSEQAEKIVEYLFDLKDVHYQLEYASTKLRNLWMNGTYALKATDSQCPTNHISWEGSNWAPKQNY